MLINTVSLYLAIKRWAVDINPHACESLRLNHAKTEVILSILSCSLYFYLFLFEFKYIFCNC